MQKRRKNSLKIKIIAILLCFTVLLSVCYFKMQPVIMRFAVSTAETIMLNSANEAVIKILEENNVTYSDIARLSLNDNGYVSSLEIDVYEINNLKSRISNETARIIEEKEYFEVSIPIGTFLGNTYTAGFGPKVKFKMQLTTTAFVDFSHEFRSAGINQVLHIINVDINIGGSLIIAGFNRGINVKTSAIAAQTVIVGATPDAFTNVIESEKDNTGGLINDYGAIIE
jgi:sporulation protein YunB